MQGDLTITKDKICAVVVTYNPDATVLANVRALLEQAQEVVVVDNGSRAPFCDHVKILDQFHGVTVQWNGANLGIAAALNIGVKWALNKGYAWIATFDQDSTITPNMFSKMAATYDQCADKDNIAILCPRYRDHASGYIILNRTRRLIHTTGAEVFWTMTSGNLVNGRVFDVVGDFKTELFIDLVDFEFCLRCRRHGYRIVESQTAWLNHSLGSPRRIQFFGTTQLLSNHSAVRRYYWSRNMVWILRHYWPFLCRHSRSAYIELKYSVLSFGALVLFDSDRSHKLRHVMRGLYDGLRGKLGPFDPS